MATNNNPSAGQVGGVPVPAKIMQDSAPKNPAQGVLEAGRGVITTDATPTPAPKSEVGQVKVTPTAPSDWSPNQK
jgi:hypothetical protein